MKKGRLRGWDWGGDDTDEWGKGRRAMVPQSGSGCQDFEPQVEGDRERSLFP